MRCRWELLLAGSRKRRYVRTARITKPRRWQFIGNSRGTGANICIGGCLTVPATETMPPNQSSLRCLRSSVSLNRTPGNPTCHVANVLQKMIRSIVLALLLFCQSINIGRCLRANGTHDEISKAAQQHRLRRSLTFPDPSVLLVCNWLINWLKSRHWVWRANCWLFSENVVILQSRTEFYY